MKDVRKLRAYCDDLGKDWERFKRQQTRRSGKVSDPDFLEWWNSDEGRARMG
jgi:hypothetical protein